MRQKQSQIDTLAEQKKEALGLFDSKQQEVDHLRSEIKLYSQKLTDSQEREMKTNADLSEIRERSVPLQVKTDRLEQEKQVVENDGTEPALSWMDSPTKK